MSALGVAPRVLPLGQAAAVLAVGSAGVHLALAGSGDLSALAMALMALVCLPCSLHLWRAPTASVWGLTALVDLGMLAVHLPMVVGTGHAGMHGAHTAASGPSALVVGGLVLVGGQLLLAGTALLRR
ncbi:hypothetical protein [Modestobacter sp. Leaf380]|uniref:hypothetical protein n=1 Tax=Modestobacter sp. Leaf380 TaxID=1736356 RepID=UPI0006FF0D17|nr:hypothetical protein [Modestobacter sp. Leaf380]KQS69170.1 hypothetical protein ASG41_22095 [Modestobacter sp. Leaf380]